MSLAFSSLFAFIVALGVLVTVHEFGHYWVARRMGVKVLRFSIGFGKPIYRWRLKNNETEFVVAAIPLGGYVKMLDEREGTVDPAERHFAFNNQSIWSRIAIVSAGPLANVVMAVAVYALVFSLGITGTKPVVGEVQSSSIAADAGFQYKDTIIEVDGEKVDTWRQVQIEILDSLMSRSDFIVRVITESGNERDRSVQLHDSLLLKEQGDIIHNLGLVRWWPEGPPVIGEVLSGGAAERAGLQAGDKIISTNGEPVKSASSWIEQIRNNPNVPLELEISRDGKTLMIMITPDEIEESGRKIGRVNAGISRSHKADSDMQTLVRYPVPKNILKGFEKTYDMSVLTLKMIGELVAGRASTKNISGPITIAEYAGRSININFIYYLDLIAFISISLAVLNMLPIPLLDGGHLLYYTVELVKGSPVSEAFEAVGQRIGALLLACLMVLAIYNDLTRLLS